MPEFDAKTWELLKAMLLMAVLLVIVALGIQLITMYRRRLNVRSSDSRAEQAELFREAYESGEIDTEEYRQIQDALDRGQAPPPLGVARLRDPNRTAGNLTDPQSERAPRQADTPPLPERSPEDETEDSAPPRSE